MLVEMEFEAFEEHGTNGRGRRVIVEQPSPASNEFEGAEDESLVQHEVVGHA